MSIKELQPIIQELFGIVRKLEEMYHGRKFTIDGHLVGSIGEVIAAEIFDLQLLPASAKTHDAIAPDGKKVQIKATQVVKIALSSEPDYLIVLKILKNGEYEVIYNGPGSPVWEQCGKMQKNGQRPISLKKLKDLMNQTEEDKKLKKR